MSRPFKFARKRMRTKQPAATAKNAGPCDANVLGALAQVPAPRERVERARAQIAEPQAYKRELGPIGAAASHTRDGDAAAKLDANGASVVGRARLELDAIMAGIEEAVGIILEAAEDIDAVAQELADAAQATPIEKGASDIRHRVARLYAACHVHDITGQRVTKVRDGLTFVERHVAQLAEIWRNVEQFDPVVLDTENDPDARMLGGPRLRGETGHCSQDDIDALFNSR